MDGLKLFAKNNSELKQLLKIVKGFTDDIDMGFRPGVSGDKGREKLGTNFKCDIQRLPSIYVMKWAIILSTCNATKIGLGGSKPCPNF